MTADNPQWSYADRVDALRRCILVYGGVFTSTTEPTDDGRYIIHFQWLQAGLEAGLQFIGNGEVWGVMFAVYPASAKKSS